MSPGRDVSSMTISSVFKNTPMSCRLTGLFWIVAGKLYQNLVPNVLRHLHPFILPSLHVI
jgi:hypothetical protein